MLPYIKNEKFESKEKLFDCFAILAQGKEDIKTTDKIIKPYINFTYPADLQQL